MALKKVAKNIYYDPKCTLRPYVVNVSLQGVRFSGSYISEELAVEARDEFITKVEDEYKIKDYKVKKLMPTREKHIWINPMNKQVVIHLTITKSFPTMARAIAMRNKLVKYTED